MNNTSQLYTIAEPDAPAAAGITPSDVVLAAAAPLREHSWRDLMRRLEKNLPRPRSRSK